MLVMCVSVLTMFGVGALTPQCWGVLGVKPGLVFGLRWMIHFARRLSELLARTAYSVRSRLVMRRHEGAVANATPWSPVAMGFSVRGPRPYLRYYVQGSRQGRRFFPSWSVSGSVGVVVQGRESESTL